MEAENQDQSKSETPEPTISLTEIVPPELLAEIAGFLDADDALTFRLVNSDCCDAIDDAATGIVLRAACSHLRTDDCRLLPLVLPDQPWQEMFDRCKNFAVACHRLSVDLLGYSDLIYKKRSPMPRISGAAAAIVLSEAGLGSLAPLLRSASHVIPNCSSAFSTVEELSLFSSNAAPNELEVTYSLFADGSPPESAMDRIKGLSRPESKSQWDGFISLFKSPYDAGVVVSYMTRKRNSSRGIEPAVWETLPVPLALWFAEMHDVQLTNYTYSLFKYDPVARTALRDRPAAFSALFEDGNVSYTDILKDRGAFAGAVRRMMELSNDAVSNQGVHCKVVQRAAIQAVVACGRFMVTMHGHDGIPEDPAMPVPKISWCMQALVVELVRLGCEPKEAEKWVREEVKKKKQEDIEEWGDDQAGRNDANKWMPHILEKVFGKK